MAPAAAPKPLRALLALATEDIFLQLPSETPNKLIYNNATI